MPSPTEIAKPFKQTNAGPLEYWYGPYASLAAAKTAVPSELRYGKTIGVITSGIITEYIWHPGDITDSGLVAKTSGGGGGASSFTALNDSPYDNASLAAALISKENSTNKLLSGCELTPGVTSIIADGSWVIQGVAYTKNATSFSGISLSGSGLLRSVAFYGLTNSTVEKVESAELPAYVAPDNNISNKALLRWMIVGDATFQNQAVDYEKFALKADLGNKATLTTEDKTNLVAAVNEVKGTLDSQSSDQITLKIFKVSNYGTP